MHWGSTFNATAPCLCCLQVGHEAFAQWRRDHPQDYLTTLGKWEGDKRGYDPRALAEGEVPGSYVPILPSLLAYISLEDRQALRWGLGSWAGGLVQTC